MEQTTRSRSVSVLLVLLAGATIFGSACNSNDKNRRGDPGDLPPLGSAGEESARISGKTLEESLTFYKKSLVVLLGLHGESHAEVADTYEKMARVYQESGDRAGTLEYFGKALKSRRAIYRRDHPAVLQTLKNSADAYMKVGDVGSAIRYYNEFQLAGMKVYGANHAEMLESYEKMGDGYAALGQPQEALKHYQVWARQIQKSPTLGRKHPEMARAYNKLGDLYYKMGKVPEAEKLKEEAVGILYPTAGAKGTLLRSRFHVSMKSSDPKRNKAKVTYPDNVTVEHGSRLVPMPTRRAVRIISVPILDEYDITNVEMARVEKGKGLLFYLNSTGAQRLSEVSEIRDGLSLVLLVNGNAIAERPIAGKILNGQLFTFVEMPDELLEKMVFSLKETCKQLSGGGTRTKLSGN